MFKYAIFSFQIPILTTLIQPPLKASTTPWILTACCERPSIAWEGNEHHCIGWLQREGFAIPHCCFCSLNTRLQTFYTLCKRNEYVWLIMFYVYEGIYMCIPASKVYMNLAAAKPRRDISCGNNQWSSAHYFSGLHRSVRCVRLCKRHESSSELAPHTASPSATSRGEKCSSFSLSLFLWAFFCSFFNPVFGHGVTLWRRVRGNLLDVQGNIVYV